jgi:8-oxo-dGTP pyrophosphatase MutT (NUDIX family)
MALFKWITKRSEIAFDSRWLRVRADDCENGRGVSIAPYYVLEFSDFVHVVAVDTSGCLILVNQYRHGSGCTSLELPGGVVEATDTSPVEAAIRELAEETGYKEGRYRHVGTFSVDPARYSNRLHLVVAEDLIEGQSRPDSTEEIEVVRVPIGDAAQLARDGKILNAAHVGLLMMGLNHIGSRG